MRWLTVILLTAVVAFAAAQELPLAEPCDPQNCQLPNCRCSSTDIPGGLAARDTPQFVLITFDDAVNVINIETYREHLYGRINYNKCPIGTTFYVNHEYTDYRLVNELYNNGFEIGLHSISHQSSQDYWREGTYEDMWKEFADQRTQMSHFANIPASELRGVRKPFLEMGGNATMKVIADAGLLYDCSWPAINTYDPGLWPYTLDYASTQECPIPPCPTASVPGVWVLPMIPFVAPNGFPCSMVDACTSFPDRNDGDAWYQFIMTNFERQYLGNRAPFGFYVHAWYLMAYPGVLNGLTRFLDTLKEVNDVFVVNSHEVIDWVRNPVPVNEYRTKPCRTYPRTACSLFNCLPLEHNDQLYYMQHCNVCPASYPWLGNPLGY